MRDPTVSRAHLHRGEQREHSDLFDEDTIRPFETVAEKQARLHRKIARLEAAGVADGEGEIVNIDTPPKRKCKKKTATEAAENAETAALKAAAKAAKARTKAVKAVAVAAASEARVAAAEARLATLKYRHTAAAQKREDDLAKEKAKEDALAAKEKAKAGALAAKEKAKADAIAAKEKSKAEKSAAKHREKEERALVANQTKLAVRIEEAEKIHKELTHAEADVGFTASARDLAIDRVKHMKEHGKEDQGDTTMIAAASATAAAKDAVDAVKRLKKLAKDIDMKVVHLRGVVRESEERVAGLNGN